MSNEGVDTPPVTGGEMPEWVAKEVAHSRSWGPNTGANGAVQWLADRNAHLERDREEKERELTVSQNEVAGLHRHIAYVERLSQEARNSAKDAAERMYNLQIDLCALQSAGDRQQEEITAKVEEERERIAKMLDAKAKEETPGANWLAAATHQAKFEQAAALVRSRPSPSRPAGGNGNG